MLKVTPASRHRRATGAIAAAVAAAISWGVAEAAHLSTSSARLTVRPASVCVLTPAADAYVDELSSLLNFGTGTSLRVRSEALANRRALVRFDLGGCAIPSTADVRSATVKLRLSSAPASSRTWVVHRLTQTWGETTVTWLDQPTAALTATASVATGTTSGVTLDVDVAADVRGFVTGTVANYGWRVADGSESALLAVEGAVESRESSTTSHRPLLIVTYS